MHRVIRWIFAVACTFVCLASIALWIRSYFASDIVVVSRGVGGDGDMIACSVGRGKFALEWFRGRSEPPIPVRIDRTPRFLYYRWSPRDPRFRAQLSYNQFGFAINRVQQTFASSFGGNVTCDCAGVGMPLWLVTLPSLGLSTIGVLRIRRDWVRRGPNACRSCGYDLRAAHEKCPECGADSHVKAKPITI